MMNYVRKHEKLIEIQTVLNKQPQAIFKSQIHHSAVPTYTSIYSLPNVHRERHCIPFSPRLPDSNKVPIVTFSVTPLLSIISSLPSSMKPLGILFLKRTRNSYCPSAITHTPRQRGLINIVKNKTKQTKFFLEKIKFV